MTLADLVVGFRLALGTLTTIPVGNLGALTRTQARLAMLCAPLAALPLGTLVALLLWGGTSAGLSPLVMAVVTVGVLAYGTRAMHIDGLADTADGFGAGWDRERAVTVMKTGDVGPMGVASLFVALGLQAAALVALADHPVLVGATVVASRTACTVTASSHWPSARPEGMGSLMAGSVPRGLVFGSVCVSTLVLVGASVLCGLAWWQGLLAMGGAIVAWVVLAQRATRVFGGISGDIFGAAIEIGLTIMLVVLSARGSA